MNAEHSNPNRIPVLAEEVIGCIFDHIIPQQFLNNDPAEATLKTSCLVSHQFAYYGRRGLYRSVYLSGTRQVRHYLDLCQRYNDMPTHIKWIDIGSRGEEWNKDAGAKPLAALLDILAARGAVARIRILFYCPWDQWKPVVQTALIRFLLARTFDVIELGKVCLCFPFDHLPFPWMSKRVSVHGLARDGGVFAAACSSAGTSDEVVEACRIPGARVMTRFNAPLESLWIQADGFYDIGPCMVFPTFQGFREIHLANIYEPIFPMVAAVLTTTSETLEHLSFFTLRAPTCNFSYLSHIASITFPKLHTLSITTTIEPDDGPLKSLAWFLLHARRNKQLQVNKLNLVFVDLVENSPIAFINAPVRNTQIIDNVFRAFDFTKLDGVLQEVLRPDAQISIWFLLTGMPMHLERMIIRQGIEKSLPRLHAAKRVERAVGGSEEHLRLCDALSISPWAPFMSRYKVAEQQVQPSDNLKRWYPGLFNE